MRRGRLNAEITTSSRVLGHGRTAELAANHVSCIWPEADAKLRKLWAAGVPCADIGAELGVSSRSVIGRAGRLELGRHPSRKDVVLPPRKPGNRPHRRNSQLPAAAAAVTLPKLRSAPKLVNAARPAVAHRPSGTCEFIHGDVRLPGWRFCGEPVVELGSAWCRKHKRVVYQARPVRLLEEV